MGKSQSLPTIHSHTTMLTTLPASATNSIDLAPATASSSDEVLMARIQARDESALAELIASHRNLLRTVISRIVQNDHDVDDAMQDVFIEVWTRSHLYDASKGKALGWVITMARRRAIDRVRRRQAHDRAEERMRLTAENDPLVEAVDSSVEGDANISDCAEMLQRAMRTLPDAQREALELAYYHGLSQREIAAKTNTPLGTVKTRLELGLRKVRALVIASGGHQEWSLAA
jgi:RNA polymerase sigma-70 factor (ECF subfamily)